MRKIVVVGDISTGHDGFGPQACIEGSPTATLNGKPIARAGDAWSGHTKKKGRHDGVVGASTSTVLLNGRPIMLEGEPLSCGDIATATEGVGGVG